MQQPVESAPEGANTVLHEALTECWNRLIVTDPDHVQMHLALPARALAEATTARDLAAYLLDPHGGLPDEVHLVLRGQSSNTQVSVDEALS